ncbi:archaeal heat shock protein Hsp20 [Archaeoglobus profundus]|uniref:Heat shock protein Hsp20 n=1 Tax=Archaeoglobus profundus (strain DSM 5631 / JCM 9629 / NBRC 100127 / Av18) TaxID=572546 RepID=D2RHU8_ARCPA|nr:archaeal heat shock protein Hsp20 [Archaeoglobus profundus]ADB57873.1 heat shock protein Hsp20 [Archaeoglobus profundus DSM 5631]
MAWWRRRRREEWEPFDIFGREFDFIDEIFERMVRDIEEMFRRFERGEGEMKPIIRGFSIRIGPDGKPEIKEFGTKPEISETGIEERKPLIDVIETDEEVQVIAEMPGVSKEDIELNATERELEIKAESENRRYYERVELPCEVIPDSAKARYNNGVLEVIFKKKYPEKKGKKIKVE